MRALAGWLGLSAVALFAIALSVFAVLNPDFGALEDYVSKLGARGQPHALWWNLLGFLAVGGLLAAFGHAFGRVLGDRVVGALLVAFGIGFAATALPMDMTEPEVAVSKGHVVAICLGLAAWLIALSRMAHSKSVDGFFRATANVAAILIVLPIMGQGLRLWPMPTTHRLVFLVVFEWVAAMSTRLLAHSGANARPRAT